MSFPVEVEIRSTTTAEWSPAQSTPNATYTALPSGDPARAVATGSFPGRRIDAPIRCVPVEMGDTDESSEITYRVFPSPEIVTSDGDGPAPNGVPTDFVYTLTGTIVDADELRR